MTRPVIESIEDESGDRCLDLIRLGDRWSWVECRRDPEDAHVWRRLYPPRGDFADRAAALADARREVEWLGA